MNRQQPSPSRLPLPRPIDLRAGIFTFLGVLLLLFLWQIAAMVSHSVAVASPAETFHALGQLVGTDEFQRHFWLSLARMMGAIAAGGAVGFALGIMAGLSRDVRHLLEPLRWTAMSIPPVTVLVLFMLWLGLGTRMVITMTAFMLAPIVYVNTVKGMELVDRRYVEAARVFRFPLGMRLRAVYVPALAAPLAAAMIHVVASGVRVVILAELIGAHDGIGAAIATANSNLQIPQLFAWIAASVALVGFFEYALLRPVQRHMTRWNQP